LNSQAVDARAFWDPVRRRNSALPVVPSTSYDTPGKAPTIASKQDLDVGCGRILRIIGKKRHAFWPNADVRTEQYCQGAHDEIDVTQCRAVAELRYGPRLACRCANQQFKHGSANAQARTGN
jgi:hypothetical protein